MSSRQKESVSHSVLIRVPESALWGGNSGGAVVALHNTHSRHISTLQLEKRTTITRTLVALQSVCLWDWIDSFGVNRCGRNTDVVTEWATKEKTTKKNRILVSVKRSGKFSLPSKLSWPWCGNALWVMGGWADACDVMCELRALGLLEWSNEALLEKWDHFHSLRPRAAQKMASASHTNTQVYWTLTNQSN